MNQVRNGITNNGVNDIPHVWKKDDIEKSSPLKWNGGIKNKQISP